MNTRPKPLPLLASLVIDFFRWSQLTPMILMWAAMLGLLLLLVFVSNEEASWTLVERVITWVASLPVIGPRFVAWMDAQASDGVIRPEFGLVDLKSTVLSAWGFISLGFMGLAWLAGLVIGPFKPWTLTRKLGLAALACLLVVAVFLALFVLDPEAWNDPLWKMLLSSLGMAAVLFVVSAWCLTVSHLLGLLSAAVAKAEFSEPNARDGLP